MVMGATRSNLVPGRQRQKPKNTSHLAHVLRLRTRVSPALLHRAKFEPKAVLEELLQASRCSFPEFLQRVRDAESNPLLGTPEIEALLGFLGLAAPAASKRSRLRRAAGR